MYNNNDDLAAAEGSYSPTFFKMFVGTDNDLNDLLNLTDRDAALFLHEYIHYLQDISTTYGLLNICNNVNRMREANLQISKTEGETFYIPIYPTPQDQYQVFQNLTLGKIYLGSNNNIEIGIDNAIISITINEQRVAVGENKETLVNIINIVFENGLEYQFGATCIMECAAYLIENIMYPGAIPSPPTLPYRAVEMLVNFIYPEFGLNKLNILALADAALLVFHPGDFFLKVLTYMKDNLYMPEQPAVIYKYINQIEFNYEGQTTIDDLLKFMSNKASDMLSSYLVDKNYAPTVTWVKETLSNALKLRLSIRDYVLDVAQSGNIKENILFRSVFKELGTPMIVNSLQKIWFHPCQSSETIVDYSAMKPVIFWAINQIHKLFARGQTHCEMISYCQNECDEEGKPDITDNSCNFSPWSRAAAGLICPYSQVWHMWNLTHMTPVHR